MIKRAIATKYLPARTHLILWFCLYTSMNYHNSPSWTYGIFWTIFVLSQINFVLDATSKKHSKPMWEEDSE